jgi:hypothetical protein
VAVSGCGALREAKKRQCGRLESLRYSRLAIGLPVAKFPQPWKTLNIQVGNVNASTTVLLFVRICTMFRTCERGPARVRKPQ